MRKVTRGSRVRLTAFLRLNLGLQPDFAVDYRVPHGGQVRLTVGTNGGQRAGATPDDEISDFILGHDDARALIRSHGQSVSQAGPNGWCTYGFDYALRARNSRVLRPGRTLEVGRRFRAAVSSLRRLTANQQPSVRRDVGPSGRSVRIPISLR